MSIRAYNNEGFPTHLPRLNALYRDLFSSGKGLRSKFVRRITHHVKLDKPSVQLLCQTAEFIHNASLLHDDLIDGSPLRRNKPAAWHKYTPEYAVLAGDYLLARVMVNLSQYGNLRLIQYTAEVVEDLLEGEWIQDSLVNDWNVSLESLDLVHNLKTASLFKWCLCAPFICQERYSESLHFILIELGTLLGRLFQRSDDLLDFDVRNYEKKATLGDLKSKYLNSFGVYLVQDMKHRKKLEFQSCHTMDEIIGVMGKERFDKKVESFDGMNSQLIQLCDHYLDNLKTHLKPSELGLFDDLSRLVRIIYWRRT